MNFDAVDLLAAIKSTAEAARGRPAGALTRQLSACGQRKGAVHDDRRRQGLVTAGNAPVEGETLSESAPQPQPGPTGERAVQRGEGDAGQEAGDPPLHAAEGQHPDQSQNASPQFRIRFATAAVNPDTLRLHSFQFGFGGEDEHLDVGEGVPRVALTGTEDAASRRRNHISRTGRGEDRQIW